MTFIEKLRKYNRRPEKVLNPTCYNKRILWMYETPRIYKLWLVFLPQIRAKYRSGLFACRAAVANFKIKLEHNISNTYIIWLVCFIKEKVTKIQYFSNCIFYSTLLLVHSIFLCLKHDLKFSFLI